MKFNFKVYRGNKDHRHCDAKWLCESQKELVYEMEVVAIDGNEADKKLYEKYPNIKSTWQVKKTLIER